MKSDYMDNQFLLEGLNFFEEDSRLRDLLINTEKLTRGNFNIIVPLRDKYLRQQFEEIGIPNDA